MDNNLFSTNLTKQSLKITKHFNLHPKRIVSISFSCYKFHFKYIFLYIFVCRCFIFAGKILHHTLDSIDKLNAVGSIRCQFLQKYSFLCFSLVFTTFYYCEDVKIVFLLQPFSVIFCLLFLFCLLFFFSKLCVCLKTDCMASFVRSGQVHLSFAFLLHFQLFAENGGDFALHEGPWYRWICKRTFFTAWTVHLGTRALWYQ